ncbi:sensor histidine kinase YesM [Paenibacillus baekrokdamisoli]|uniref:histidine kinase n=2 Tax=Paenibacillus baekrokdamisoli TaxID=1712516 RepID=A0A3G9J792_9BACL|nr:sensor histidine kinase YesM [Paenibacillus baekrokdamisoli]
MFYSLRSRLMLVFSILLIVPYTTFIVVLSKESSNLIQHSIETSTAQSIDQFASHVTTLLTQMEDIGTQVMSSRITQDWVAAELNPAQSIEERVLTKQRLREYFSSYAINNSNNITLSAFTENTGGLWTQDRSYLLSEWYSQFKQNDGRWTTAHKDGDQSDEIMTRREINSFLLPLVHLQSLREIGFVKINYPTAVLRDAIEKIRFGETGRVFLLTQDETSVLNQSLADNQAVLQAGLSQLAEQHSKETSGVFSVKQSHLNYLIFYRKLPAQDWIIVGAVPERELYVKIDTIRQTMLFGSFILLLIIIVVAFRLSHGITKPLSAMAKAMKHVERGEFAQAILLVPHARNGHSEIGYVTRIFERMTNRLKYLIETEFETNLRRKNAEYKALLLQINPHFYNNTLEIISGLAATKREDLVMDATEALGKMMRYSLSLNSDIVAVKEELDYMRDYLFILKLRYEDNLLVTMQEDPSANKLRIAKFILQPLIENAVKYSLEKTGISEVSLITRVEEEKLILMVKDNGIGMTKQLMENLLSELQGGEAVAILSSEGESIGLRNVLSRCRLMYGDQFQLDLESKLGEGTIITLRLPMVRG